LGEVPQSLLLYRLRACRKPRVLRSRLGELSALFQIAGCGRSATAPVRVLFDGQVPHIPGMGAVVPQHRLLGRREQPVPGHANRISTTTDNFGEVKRRFLLVLKAGVCTPRS
jgi:hypothetical protein